MPAVQTQANPPTFESVWALIQENAQKHALEWEKSSKDIERIKEIQERTAKHLEETDRIVKENSKQMGLLNNRIGEIVECIVAPNLLGKFCELGYIFNQLNTNTQFTDNNGKILFELDVFLENGDKAMLVEVKTTLTIEYLKYHIERLGRMRAYADSHGDKRVFLGAAAGIVIAPNVKEYALNQGLYVIEPSGETFNIIPPPGKPKEW